MLCYVTQKLKEAGLVIMRVIIFSRIFIGYVAIVIGTVLVETVAQEKVLRLPILDQSIEYHGGDLYESSSVSLKITSLSGSFNIEADLGNNFDYTVIGEVGRDNKYLRKVNYTNTAVREWRDGEEVKLDEVLAGSARDFVNARVFFPFLPYGLNGENVFKEDLGIEEWEGVRLHKVRVSFRLGTSTDAEDTYMYWFDPETGRVEQFAYDFKVGNGGLRFRKPLKFKRVGGILFSDQENYAANGPGLSVNLLTPDYVRNKMKLLSTIRVSDVRVEPEGS